MTIIGIAHVYTKAQENAAEQWRHPVAQALSIAILCVEMVEADCTKAGDEENSADLRQALVTLRLLRQRITGRAA